MKVNQRRRNVNNYEVGPFCPSWLDLMMIRLVRLAFDSSLI